MMRRLRPRENQAQPLTGADVEIDGASCVFDLSDISTVRGSL